MGAKRENKPLIFGLLLGDLAVLFTGLWLTLFLRYFKIPSRDFFIEHIAPFSLIFAAWLLVFYIADLYGRSFYLQRKSLLWLLLASQTANGLVASAFFYFLPFYGITPKTILFINLAVSFVLLFAWRSGARGLLSLNSKEKLIMIGSGKEFKELTFELKQNERYGFLVVQEIDSAALAQNFNQGGQEKIRGLIKENKEAILVVESFGDLPKEAAAYFYKLMFEGVEFFDFQAFYESVFQYVPLSFVNDEWILANISSSRKAFYDLPKRLIDILASFFCGAVSLVFYPFIFLAVKLNDWGPVFFVNSRIGQNGRIFKQLKFRSMRVNAEPRWPEQKDKRITLVGRFLRQTRLDEMPQLWNVLKGDMSFVGPRPDFAEFAQVLKQKIPYYNIRNLIKPGLTGWAQIQQDAPTSVEETHKRLAYDIYYIKNRSIALDLTIILKTIRIILSRSGV